MSGAPKDRDRRTVGVWGGPEYGSLEVTTTPARGGFPPWLHVGNDSTQIVIGPECQASRSEQAETARKLADAANDYAQAVEVWAADNPRDDDDPGWGTGW